MVKPYQGQPEAPNMIFIEGVVPSWDHLRRMLCLIA